MSTRITYIALSAGLLWLSGCAAMKSTASQKEVDDIYYNSADAERDKLESDHARFESRQVSGGTSASDSPSGVDNSDYEETRASKYGEDEEMAYSGDYDPYSDDDFVYSRRVRRFSTRSWGYYDPYFAYDPYYVMGTPTWSYYSRDPWFYDPYFYNGPSYSWTYGWGNGNSNFGYQNGWYNPWGQSNYYGNSWGSGWGNGWGPGFNSGWGTGYGFGGGGYYSGGYGGYGNYGGFSNGYCPPGPFYGGGYGNGFGNGGSSTSSGINGPRNNPSTLNTNAHPGNSPTVVGSQVRPYQDPSDVNPRPVVTNTVIRPTTGAVSRPSNTVGTSPRPVSPSNPSPKPVYESRPTNNNVGVGTNPRPGTVESRPVTPSPRPVVESRPVAPNNNVGSNPRPTISRPAPSSNPTPTYRPSGGTSPSPTISRPNPSPSPSGGSISAPRNAVRR
jgi:hypothetical protein